MLCFVMLVFTGIMYLCHKIIISEKVIYVDRDFDKLYKFVYSAIYDITYVEHLYCSIFLFFNKDSCNVLNPFFFFFFEYK